MIFSKTKNIFCIYDFVTLEKGGVHQSYYQIKKLFSENEDLTYSLSVNQLFFEQKNNLPFLFFKNLDGLIDFNKLLTEKTDHQYAFCLSLSDYNLSLPSVRHSSQWMQMFEEYGQKVRFETQVEEGVSIWKKLWGSN